MATLKFYDDKAKQNQVYPDINPDGVYPGVTVGLANNLTSPSGVEDSATFIYRTTAGVQDVSEGYATLKKLTGNASSTTIPESLHYNLMATGVTGINSVAQETFKGKIGNTSGTYNFIYTPIISYNSELIYSLDKNTFARYASMTTGTYEFTYTPVVAQVDTSSVISSFNSETFVAKVNEEPNTYTFKYDGSKWQLNNQNVTMSEYGIVTNGSEQQDTEIIIYYTSNSWYRNGSSVSLANFGITTTGDEKIGDKISIEYERNEWQLKDSAANISEYGISIIGTPAIADTIQIVFVAEEIGHVATANPTSLLSTGLNQFNKNGNQIISGASINTSGLVESKSNSYVIYFKCVGNNTYTIYNSIASSTGVVATAPIGTQPIPGTQLTVLNTVSQASSGQSVANNSTRGHYTPTEDCYLCVSTTDIENLCCHLTWSGYNDDVYESYWDYEFHIPYKDQSGSTISEYGLAKLDSTYVDEIDFENHRFYKRTERVAYSAQKLSEIQALSVPFLYDSNWIYYGVSETIYNLDDSVNASYQVSDFGTEEFLDTEIGVTANILYQENLKDKLRRSVEVLENKTQTISASSTADEYPSAKAVYDMEYLVWKMLGLHVDTFSTTKTYAVGDYVVRNHTLYKCKTAVTAAGAWNANNWTESYLFTAN